LDEESIGAESANFFQGGLGGLLVAEIMNGDLRSTFCQLQRDAAPNASGTSGNQGFLPLE